MSDVYRQRASNLRQPSVPYGGTSSGHSPALLARINEKKQELENYKELCDLSGKLAAQMQMLEDKLATVADGAEAVAAVLSNWQDVLKAINMASIKSPKPKESEGDDAPESAAYDLPLPQTLIRIPVPQSSRQMQKSGEE